MNASSPEMKVNNVVDMVIKDCSEDVKKGPHLAIFITFKSGIMAVFRVYMDGRFHVNVSNRENSKYIYSSDNVDVRCCYYFLKKQGVDPITLRCIYELLCFNLDHLKILIMFHNPEKFDLYVV